ncbi:TetR/AcrR family transcriptional regulator [Brachybacterium sp. J153]|uniref:TetR/AcrR family transcriptional regulator n=1 Tax=Brachybacterium sp. J153 TaxID=3116488 RepID=UPI002E78F184|nr:TetR/AcrR family transcriptional regulator [Brachybacterium sp. J153]MEE1618231.1 TetR/AcrR family transcriptional regulator [Brachybacterium sp. J153]
MNATTQAPVDGRSARWAQHREQRRGELLDVARHLIHERGPDVTMEDIAAASGTSKSIVYRYFEDKAHLQAELGRAILSSMHRRLLEELRGLERRSGREPAPEERIRAMIAAYVETAQRSPGVYRFVTRPSDGLNHFLAAVTRLVASFLPAGTPSPQVWAHGAVGFVERAVDSWMTSVEAAAADGPTAPTVPSAASDPPSAPHPAPRPALLTADQLVTHLVTWLMKGLHP